MIVKKGLFGIAALLLLGLLIWGGTRSAHAACSGTINGGDNTVNCTGSTGVDVDLQAGNDTLTNSGTMNGNVSGNTGNDTIVNSGTMNGDVDGGPNNDIIVNTGKSNGDLLGGDGDDTISTSGIVYATIDGGPGNDTVNINGGIVDETVNGNTGYDTINFAMEFNDEEAFDLFNWDIAFQAPASGTVEIGESSISWVNFERLLNTARLSPYATMRPAAPPPIIPLPSPAPGTVPQLWETEAVCLFLVNRWGPNWLAASACNLTVGQPLEIVCMDSEGKWTYRPVWENEWTEDGKLFVDFRQHGLCAAFPGEE